MLKVFGFFLTLNELYHFIEENFFLSISMIYTKNCINAHPNFDTFLSFDKWERSYSGVFFIIFISIKKVSVIKIKLIKLCKIPVNHGLNVIVVILSFLYQSPSFFSWYEQTLNFFIMKVIIFLCFQISYQIFVSMIF